MAAWEPNNRSKGLNNLRLEVFNPGGQIRPAVYARIHFAPLGNYGKPPWVGMCHGIKSFQGFFRWREMDFATIRSITDR